MSALDPDLPAPAVGGHAASGLVTIERARAGSTRRVIRAVPAPGVYLVDLETLDRYAQAPTDEGSRTVFASR